MNKISVIVPVYKVEKTLDACVKSILAQSYTDLEIILVNDGSPDRCPEMCEKLAETDGRIKVIHRENGGLSAARNTGIDHATGDYITFVDSDDLVDPEMVSVLYGAIRKTDTDMSVCMFRVFQNESDIVKDEIKDDILTEDASELLLSGKMYERSEAWGKLYKKDVFSSLRFKEGIYYEDTHIMPYVLQRVKTLAFTKAKLYYYRKSPELGTIMNAKFSKKKLAVLDIFKEHVSLYKKLGPCPAYAYAVKQLIGCITKARVLKKQLGIGFGFYKYYFKLFPSIVFAPRLPEIAFKQKAAFIGLIVPFGMFNSYYRKNITVRRYDDLNNL